MKLNSELKQIFNPLRLYIKKELKKLDKIKEGHTASVYVKTPHIFYRKVVVYLYVNDKLIEITDQIENDETLEPKWLKAQMAQAYMNYFTHYQEIFKSAYYRIDFLVENGDVVIRSLEGDKSPDPIDANGTKIRK